MSDTLAFDPEYASREVPCRARQAPEGRRNAQYQKIDGQYAHYLDDPYVEPGFTRAALTDEVDVAVIAGVSGGLLAGARLLEAGVKTSG